MPGLLPGKPVTAAAAPRRPGLVLAVIATAQLMVVLDLTIVVVALPHIQAMRGFSGTNLEGVVNAYGVAFAGAGWTARCLGLTLPLREGPAWQAASRRPGQRSGRLAGHGPV